MTAATTPGTRRRSEWTAGAAVVDLPHYTGRPATARVAIELDQSKYWTKLADAITLIG